MQITFGLSTVGIMYKILKASAIHSDITIIQHYTALYIIN